LLFSSFNFFGSAIAKEKITEMLAEQFLMFGVGIDPVFIGLQHMLQVNKSV
jgi:hypothetical protein